MNISSKNLSFFRSLRGQLIALLLSVSVLPLLIMGTLAYMQTKAGLEESAIRELTSMRNIKADQVENFFNERLADVMTFSTNLAIIDAMREFDKALENLKKDEGLALEQHRPLYLKKPNLADAGDSSTYSAVHAKYHPMMKKYMEAFGYYDIFLIEPHHGIVIYTVTKEDDFGTNLNQGIYSDTNLAEIFKDSKKAKNTDFTAIKDFAYYAPSQSPSPFVASPIFDQSELLGVLVFQLSMEQIDSFMQNKAGLGKTGETFLVNSDDFLLRSSSQLSKETAFLDYKIDNEATRAAAAGQSGVKIIKDDQNHPIIFSYQPLNIKGLNWSLIAKMDETEALATAKPIMNMILIIISIILIVVIAIALLMSKSIVHPITAMADIARQLATGNINQHIEIKNKSEIGLMGNAFKEMVENLQQVINDIVQVSGGLAKGDLSVIPQAHYKGDFTKIRTSLETGLSNLRSVIADIVQMSQDLAKGNKKAVAEIEYQGDFVQIKEALEIASSRLSEAKTRNDRENWLKTGLAELNSLMSGEQKIDGLAKKVITFLATYSGGQIGLFYVLKECIQNDKAPYLELAGSYAYVVDENMTLSFNIGEGLVGQAALDKKMLIFKQARKDSPTIVRSGLGNVQLCYVLFFPLLYEGNVKGVIEIGASKELTEMQRDFLEQTMPIISIALNTTESRDKMEILLSQSQQQAEELQTQQEELQTQQENI